MKNILEKLNQEAMNRVIQQGLRDCLEANEILAQHKSYTQIATSIWQNIDNEDEYIVCLSAKDYSEGDLRSPQDWGWKVPGILSLHLGIKGKEFFKDFKYGAIEGTDFYLFLLRMIG